MGGVQSNGTEIPHSESPLCLNSSHDINDLTICEHVYTCLSVCIGT